MEKQLKPYCAGHFLTTGRELEVKNPFNGQVFGRTWQCGDTELEKAIQAAESVKTTLRNLPSWKRQSILLFIADGISRNKEEFVKVMIGESGKPYRYSLGEVERAIQVFRVASEEAKRLPKEYISLDWTPVGENKEGLVKYFPAGIVAGISPFNFPLNLAVHKIAPAIAAGCPIILKPSSLTPMSTLLLATVIDASELPKGAVSVLPMDRKSGNRLVTDERIAVLSFTGSPPVGWEMKKNAGKKKVILELGGNAGVILGASADLSKALPKCMVAAFAYSGQICIHAQRFFVHESLWDAFIKEFTAKAGKMKNADPAEKETEISVMIDEENAKRVEAWIQEAVQEGAQLLLGGKRSGTFVEPTVLTNTKSSMKVCSMEVFGPVVTMEKFSAFEDAIRMINDTAFGLQAGVFTNDISEMDMAFNGIEAGGVILNDVPTFRMDHMPYGGVKDSGLGREGVKYAIRDMMEARILVK